MNYIVYCPGLTSRSLIGTVCDKKNDASEEHVDVLKYFNNAHKTFTDRIMKLSDHSRSVTADEEKELHFMFDALLSAKWLLPNKKTHPRRTKKK